MTTNTSRARLLAGVLLKDLPLYLSALSRGGNAYLAIRNRAERLEPAPTLGIGYRCDWQWTTELHAPKIVPSLGRLLMRRALAAHPIGNTESPGAVAYSQPQVSFLIGHRGTARLPHLLATVNSIAAQREVTVECIVVEQETVSQVRSHLPPWVRLVHTPPPSAEMPYCRSWAFNVGARHARGAVLVLHDNDMLIPVDYAAYVLARIAQGYEVINAKRFIFYLNCGHTADVFQGKAGLLDEPPDTIVQNLEGGGSVAITRAGFDLIGGMDESFIGWGGEDNEFWQRAQTLRTWPWGALPLVHLWHEAQPGKRSGTQPNQLLHLRLRRMTAPERIRILQTASQGHAAGPAGPHGT